jgi:hypothetical protein|eukprot:COSAG02_NODE_1036_length_15051_cov_25.548154_9_plen_85_part_00
MGDSGSSLPQTLTLRTRGGPTGWRVWAGMNRRNGVHINDVDPWPANLLTCRAHSGRRQGTAGSTELRLFFLVIRGGGGAIVAYQ